MANKFPFLDGHSPRAVQSMNVANAVVIEVGDILKDDGAGNVTPITASTDNLDIIGVAVEAHRAVDPAGKISVGLIDPTDIYTYALDAATDIIVGDALALNNKESLTKNTTDPVATAVETGTQLTKVRCVFRLPVRFVGDLV